MAQFAEFGHFLSDPGQPLGMKIAAVLGVALVLGLVLFGAWWMTIRLPSLIARSICDNLENVKRDGWQSLFYDLARLKVDYDEARQQGLSSADALSFATDKTIERSKAESASRTPGASAPPPS